MTPQVTSKGLSGSRTGGSRVNDWKRSAWIPRHLLGSEISSLLIETPVLRNEKIYLFFPVKKIYLLLQIRQALSLHLLSEKAKVSNELSYFQTKLGNSAKPVIFTSFFLC
jgi:hypothetical protein